MNILLTLFPKLQLRPQVCTGTELLNLNSVRYASKKASGGTRNKPKGKGQGWGIKKGEGHHVNKFDIIATQNRLRWHGGLNVGVRNRFTLVALTEGTVIFTSEKTDLDWNHSWNQKFYAGKEGVTFYKKYAHVIPRPLHNRFKVIQQV